MLLLHFSLGEYASVSVSRKYFSKALGSLCESANILLESCFKEAISHNFPSFFSQEKKPFWLPVFGDPLKLVARSHGIFFLLGGQIPRSIVARD